MSGLLATPGRGALVSSGGAGTGIIPPIDLDEVEDDDEEEEEEFEDFEALYPRLMPEEATSWKQLKVSLVQAENLLEQVRKCFILCE
jgi:hypothetical protein